MFTAIATWYIMPIVILIIWMALTFLKKNFAKYWPKRLRIIDIMMLVLLLGIHGLSVTLTGLSLLPFLAFAASAFGLVLTVYLVYTEDDFRVRRFFVIYWRTLDIFIVGMYIILLLIQVASFLGIM
ncbi:MULTISPECIES: DUF3397 family protein [Ligilactobacillus]|uniref:DUF3397 family protein n=2 Tax=Ligilactobacillus animalis TaxID=1605 RepID=A0AAJ6K5C0_9LACO|nr:MULTISPECIES: DUF3397 family protein [Ligilactobacillus]KDA45394.1 hypothetical protein Lani381_1572 [Ligilactobacillus animalis]MBU5278635.1 DUF3397 domain-containing protein [Ligilactobacillus animalis]MCI5941044.1 DUF3397 domain-containing protein [Ligilactobacillus animalis]MDQ2233938.1 DUF3397 domain-containing protein [Ligilactobacillus animalis]MDU1487004.1 DUF3397 family protein [Ligilactobacillus animalis]